MIADDCDVIAPPDDRDCGEVTLPYGSAFADCDIDDASGDDGLGYQPALRAARGHPHFAAAARDEDCDGEDDVGAYAVGIDPGEGPDRAVVSVVSRRGGLCYYDFAALVESDRPPAIYADALDEDCDGTEKIPPRVVRQGDYAGFGCVHPDPLSFDVCGAAGDDCPGPILTVADRRLLGFDTSGAADLAHVCAGPVAPLPPRVPGACGDCRTHTTCARLGCWVE